MLNQCHFSRPAGKHPVLPMILLAITVALITTLSAAAQTFTVLHEFTGAQDGAEPIAPLISDPEGNLYSTTYNGGIPFSQGVIFKIDPTGKLTPLHFFIYEVDGSSANAGLVRDDAGNLYGATPGGGPFLYGTVFKLDPTNKETILHKFTGGADGGTVFQSLLLDSAGNLYGAAFYGGDPTCSCGTIFKIDNAGAFSVLHTFTGPDGVNPYGTLIKDRAGNLYGTTEFGGDLNAGTVFKLSAGGVLTVLHSFTGGDDGNNPAGGPYMDSSGNLYGTTFNGGTANIGVIYKIDVTGLTVLHSFIGSDGAHPRGQVIQDSLGNFYGTTYQGGDFLSLGTVYKLDRTGTVTTLHQFSTRADGNSPYPGVYMDPAGNLYGTTFFGGEFGWGTVYKITP